MQAVADRYHTRCAELIFFLRSQFTPPRGPQYSGASHDRSGVGGSAMDRSKEMVRHSDRSKYARKYRLRFSANSEAQSLMTIVSALNGWLGVPSIISFR